MGVCVVCCNDKKAKCRSIKTKTQVRMKYRVYDNAKEIPVETRFSEPV
jgi:hypothetical protein